MFFKVVHIGLVFLLGTTLLINQSIISLATSGDLQKAREQKKQLQEKMIEKSSKAEEHQQKIAKCQRKIEEIEMTVEPLEREYRQTLDKLKEVDVLFKNRISSIYKKGETSYLASLLTAPSIQEFLRRLMVIRLITKQDFHIVDKRRKVLMEVAEKKKVYDERINEQQKYIDEAKKAYLELQKELNKDREGLEAVKCIEEEHQDELIRINLEEWKSGKLRFPYVGPLEHPAKGTAKTSGYGYRTQPITGGTRKHEGIDFAGPQGTPVYAAADGVVVSSRASSGYGWLITIYHGEYHGESLFTRYAHSYSDQVKVVVGQQVYAGKTWITSVGSNGFSTGPHLHFEVRLGKGDNPPSVNPENWLRR